MSLITLAFTPSQAEILIRDLHRAAVLLDAKQKASQDMATRGVCIAVSNRLVDLAQLVEDASRR